MIVNQHSALAGFTTDLVIKVNHRLIIALHEINLDAFDAPLLKLSEGWLKLIVERLPHYPQNNADILLLAVGHQLFDVNFRRYLEQIAEFVPAFVEDDVLNAVFGSEVDVVLVGLRVDAGLEIDAIDIIGVVPVPGDLAWLDPRCVLELRRLSQQIDHLIRDQISVSFGDADDSPWDSARPLCHRDVVGGLWDPVVSITL